MGNFHMNLGPRTAFASALLLESGMGHALRATHEKDCGAAQNMRAHFLLYLLHNQSALISKAILLVCHIKNKLIFCFTLLVALVVFLSAHLLLLLSV
jgi:hypothetical protein